MKILSYMLFFSFLSLTLSAQGIDVQRLKMAGTQEIQSEPVIEEEKQDISQADINLSPEKDKDKIVLEYIQKRPAFKDPLLAKRMYSVMRGLDNAIEKAHEEALEELDDDPEKKKEEQEKLNSQTPIRFNFKADDTAQLTQEINENPQAVVAQMISSFEASDIDENTLTNQKKQIDRMNKQFTDKMGMDVQEYQDLWKRQAQEDTQKAIPGVNYDLTNVALEGEVNVSQ